MSFSQPTLIPPQDLRTPALKQSLLSPLIVALSPYWLLLVYQLGAQWSAYEQYSYGWAVPFLCGYLIWKKAVGDGPAIRIQNSGLDVASPRHCRPGIPILLVVCLALVYAPTRVLHEANPIWRLTSWALALEVLALTWVVLRGGVRKAEWKLKLAERFGINSGEFGLRTADFIFPLCFFLVSVPWPTPIESRVVQSLTFLNVSATVAVLGTFGIPAIQHGNVLEVSTGVVGIDEACSGIRSFQVTLMLALFFGELYRLPLLRRFLLCLLGFALSFFFNLGRTTLLTWVAARRGVAAIASWHDPAGVTILVGCFTCLWLLARLLRYYSEREVLTVPPEPIASIPPAELSQFKVQGSELKVRGFTTRASGPQPWRSAILWSLALWFVAVELGTELWFRSHEKRDLSASWSVTWPGENSSFTVVPLSQEVRRNLHFDQGESGRWREADGSLWQAFYFRWLPAHSVYDRVKISLAKSHNPEICLRAVGLKLRSELEPVTVQLRPGLPLGFRQYLFDANGRQVHVFFSVSEDTRKGGSLAPLRVTHWDRVKAALHGSRNYGQRTLEIAVWGIDDPDQAKAALVRQLTTLVTTSSLPLREPD